MRGVGRLRSLFAAVSASMVVLLVAASAAYAQCTPDPAVSGDTVTCTGNDADGFAAGFGVNNLTVNVQPGATVFDNGTSAIFVNDGNAVTNRGTLNTASAGILGGSSNTYLNIGTIILGANAVGMNAVNNNTITNNGVVTGTNGSV